MSRRWGVKSTTINNGNGLFIYGGAQGLNPGQCNVSSPVSILTNTTWNLVQPQNPNINLNNTFTSDIWSQYGFPANPVPTNNYYAVFSSVVDLSPINRNQVWIYGGITNDAWALLNRLSSMQFAMAPAIQIFDYGQNSWVTPSAVTNAFPFTRVKHSATLVPSQNMIYVFGGSNVNAIGSTNDTPADIYQVLTFNLISNTWGSANASKVYLTNLSNRMFHTSTLLPNTNQILLFGGLMPGGPIGGQSIFPFTMVKLVTHLFFFYLQDSSHPIRWPFFMIPKKMCTSTQLSATAETLAILPLSAPA
ncbi:hypothetical protein DM01DRAFT_1137123 [Hesseltinella vesiculosa]|uniref:Galactose oxidase n=1 Tax=Hesseltinella vesiculosa TaxID=101127 RepID=A0A1X2G9P0_9FUNG|nr:hypothetical protein DM01DRAFT_1137123 [Hesseltinella vesiculosa]